MSIFIVFLIVIWNTPCILIRVCVFWHMAISYILILRDKNKKKNHLSNKIMTNGNTKNEINALILNHIDT